MANDPHLLVQLEKFELLPSVKKYISDGNVTDEKLQGLVTLLSSNLDSREKYFEKTPIFYGYYRGQLLRDIILSSNGIVAITLGFLTVEQACTKPELLTEFGVSALLERLITYNDAMQFKGNYVVVPDKYPRPCILPSDNYSDVSILLSENGLQALREGLITPAQAYKIRGLEALLSNYGLKALREKWITPELAGEFYDGPIARCHFLSNLLCENGLIALEEGLITAEQAYKIPQLSTLLTDIGLKALREKWITPELAGEFYHVHIRSVGSYRCSSLSYLLCENGLIALEEGLITAEQANKIDSLKMLLSDLGLEILRKKIITPEQVAKYDGRSHIWEMLLQCVELESLDLSGTSIVSSFRVVIDRQVQGIRHLEDPTVFPLSKKLKNITLSHCKLGDKYQPQHVFYDPTYAFPHIVIIFYALRSSQALEEIDLSSNHLYKLRRQDWNYIEKSLCQMPKLKKVKLYSNDLVCPETAEVPKGFIKFLSALSQRKVQVEVNEAPIGIDISTLKLEELSMNILIGELNKLQVLVKVTNVRIKCDGKVLGNILAKLKNFLAVLAQAADKEAADRVFCDAKLESITFFLFDLCLDVGEVELAREALLLIPPKSSEFIKAKSKIFQAMYIGYCTAGNDVKTSFISSFEDCLDQESHLVELTAEVQDLFDAALTEACGKRFSPGQKLDPRERANRLFVLKQELKIGGDNQEEEKVVKPAQAMVQEKSSLSSPSSSSTASTTQTTAGKPVYAAFNFNFQAQEKNASIQSAHLMRFIRHKLEPLKKLMLSFADVKLIVVDNEGDFSRHRENEVSVYTHAKEQLQNKFKEVSEILTPIFDDENVLKYFENLLEEVNSICLDIDHYLNEISDNYSIRYNRNKDITQKLSKFFGKMNEFEQALGQSLKTALEPKQVSNKLQCS